MLMKEKVKAPLLKLPARGERNRSATLNGSFHHTCEPLRTLTASPGITERPGELQSGKPGLRAMQGSPP